MPVSYLRHVQFVCTVFVQCLAMTSAPWQYSEKKVKVEAIEMSLTVGQVVMTELTAMEGIFWLLQ